MHKEYTVKNVPVPVFVAALGIGAKSPPELGAPLVLQSTATVGHDGLRRFRETLRQVRIRDQGHVGRLLDRRKSTRKKKTMINYGRL